MEGENKNMGDLGKKRKVSDAGLLEDSHSQFNNDYYMQPHRDEDLHLSESGKGKDEGGVTEESFCSNFVCCGVHLADLHALLQHYEDIHVKVQNAEDDGDAGEDDDGEGGEVDVIGDSGTASHMPGPRPGAGRTSLTNHPDRMKRTDSVLSTHSFGSTAAADALLGVAATAYTPQFNGRSRTEPPFEGQMPMGPPPGYYYGPPPPHYYAPPPPPPQQRNGEQPVSAFDTTILRTVSPAMAAASYPGGAPPAYPYYPGGHMYPMYPGMPYYGGAVPNPQGSHPYPGMPMAPQHQAVASSEKAAKRPRSTPNLKAVAAASSTLRESLPAALGTEQDPNQFKLIYSILSNTMTPSAKESAGEEEPAKEVVDKATAAKNAAAAILAMPRPPVDKSLERPYICPVPGCGKAYKNPNGLKYHALHGHDGTNELVERPYRCPYGDCGKRYKNPNGLKYHVNKNHADMLPKSALVAKSANEKDGEDHDSDSDAHDHPEGEETEPEDD